MKCVVDTIVVEIEQLNEDIDLVPKIIAKQSSPEDFEFRPLTKEEKKEFMDSLDAKGKQVLVELAGEAKTFK